MMACWLQLDDIRNEPETSQKRARKAETRQKRGRNEMSVTPGWCVGDGSEWRPRVGRELCMASILSGFDLAKAGNRGVLKFGPQS